MRRRGYTFTEILVVTMIIGILVALLLPAVQAAREAARRSRCGKHLEQLMIAAQNYEMLHGVYPPGTINATRPIRSLPQGYHHNWMVQLLPYLEQTNAAAHVDNRVGVYDPAHLPVRRLGLTLLRCPSQGYSGRGYSDYAGVHHDVEAPIDVTNNGVFFLNSRLRYEDIQDGSSNTLFFGEKITLSGDLGWMSGTRSTLRNTGVPINAARGGAWIGGASSPEGYPPGVHVDGEKTESLEDDEPALSSLFGPREEITKRAPGVQVPNTAALAVGGFGSPHPGGAQFAFGDGSVRFVSTTQTVLQQLGHRADGSVDVDLW